MRDDSLAGRIRRGAAEGLAAWLAYGTLEFAVCCALPVAWSADKTFSTWAWPMAAVFFAAYAAAGLALGGAVGALAPRLPASLTLIAAFGLNLLAGWPLARSENVALAVCVLLAGLAFTGKLRFLAGPWTAAALLLVAPWVSRDLLQASPGWVKLGASLAAIAAIAALGRWLPSPKRPWAVALAALAVMCGVTALASRRSLAVPARAANAPAGKPNVVLISMDTVRADHLSLYGYERDTTPFLRAFARGATTYTRAIAAGDGTLPSHAAIFTGLYPSWHGAHYTPPEHPWGYPLEARFHTLAELLAARGYTTAGVAANYAYLSAEWGMHQGFQAYRTPAPVFVSNWQRPFYLREGVRAVLSRFVSMQEFDARTRRGEEIDREALGFLDAASARQPFFLFLNYMDAHAPYLPPSPFDTKFPGKDPAFTEERARTVEREVLGLRRPLAARERDHMVSQYDGGIAYIDQSIARVVGKLRAAGLYDNTLIVVTADHGEAFGEHNLVDHAVTAPYQNQVHIPLVVKLPGQKDARTDEGLASQVDVLPTVLDALGYPPPATVQGVSLLRPRPADRQVYSESFPGLLFVQLHRRFDGVKRAVFSGGDKFISWTKGPAELYDLAADPQETRNLRAPGEARAAALEAQLALWGKSAPVRARTSSAARQGVVERLKSLGYAQ